MPGQVPLRTDYLANIGQSYGQGLALRRDLESSKLRDKATRAKLDQYYNDIAFRKELSEKLSGAKDFYGTGVEASLAGGKPELAIEFKKAQEAQIKEQRARIVGFADFASKIKAAGGRKLLGELMPTVGKQLLGEDADLEGVDWGRYEDNDRFSSVPIEKNGAKGVIIVDREGEMSPHFVQSAKDTYSESTVNIRGVDTVVMVNKNNPNDRVVLGKAPISNDEKKTALMKEIRDIMANTGRNYEEALNVLMTSKTQSREQFLMNFLGAIAKTGMFDEPEMEKLMKFVDMYREINIESGPGKNDSLDEILGLK